MSHEELVDSAVKAINALFGDTSVSQSQVKDELEEIIGEIEVMVFALEEDIEAAQVQEK